MVSFGFRAFWFFAPPRTRARPRSPPRARRPRGTDVHAPVSRDDRPAPRRRDRPRRPVPRRGSDTRGSRPARAGCALRPAPGPKLGRRGGRLPRVRLRRHRGRVQHGRAGHAERCCAALGTAEDARCFCDEGVVRAVRDVIGERGLEFFRSFASARCGRALTEGNACGNDASPSLGEREVNILQQQQQQQQQQQPGAFPPFPPAPAFPRAPNSPRASARALPEIFHPRRRPSSSSWTYPAPVVSGTSRRSRDAARAADAPAPGAKAAPADRHAGRGAATLDPATRAADHRAVRGRAAVAERPRPAEAAGAANGVGQDQ